MTVTRDGEPDVFAATAGGMGLTGIVLRATLRLLAVETSFARVDTERARDLDDVMARMEAGDAGYRYSVAWIDCLARGARLGRSVLMRGDHAALEELPQRRRTSPLSPLPRALLVAPPWMPNGLLRRSTIAAFNEVYFRRAPREERGRLQPLHSFFFPLDAIRGWNRMYGSRGFLQYQLVVPAGAEDALRAAIERLSGARVGSFLAVLKRFGPERHLISFPLEGWTLALDVPAAAPGLVDVLDGLDALVAGAGGRVYLTKDSRLRPDLLAAMYPRLAEWNRIRARLDPEGVMRSDLARRLALTAAARERVPA
jgi:decaprenylphospho-beta-D-ribofuranose 2-oxidase